jgi:diadenosine tetraphosphate (Ap4A) HIT family hydrolase
MDYEAALEKFAVADNQLATSEHWVAALRPKQVTLGAVVLIPNRAIDDFSGIAPEEAADFFSLVAQCQAGIRRAFHADRFNLIAAMMKDPFVHFHLIPRYKEPRDFGGTIWTDESWPELIDFGNSEPQLSAREGVLEDLRAAFSHSE